MSRVSLSSDPQQSKGLTRIPAAVVLDWTVGAGIRGRERSLYKRLHCLDEGTEVRGKWEVLILVGDTNDLDGTAGCDSIDDRPDALIRS